MNVESTIRFQAICDAARICLPDSAGAAGKTVEGFVDGFPFRAPVDAQGGFPVDDALKLAAGVRDGAMVAVEITRVGDEQEVRVPVDFQAGLDADAAAAATWMAASPKARRDWVLWLATTKVEATRAKRVTKAMSMLGGGKKRVCCFGGLGWIVKDAPNVSTWQPLPVD